MPKRRGGRLAPSREYASCKELYTLDNMSSNQIYFDLEQRLTYYKRASLIAANYQYFRIKYIKYRFLCRYNTYTATTNEAQATPIPFLYTAVDKGGSLPANTDITQLKAMGCKPTRFTRDIVRAFKPAVALAASNNNDTTVAATRYNVSPWLMTNKDPEAVPWVANDTDHRGLWWYMQTPALPGDGTYEYDCEIEVCFQFKKPMSEIGDAATKGISAHAHQQAQVLAGKTKNALSGNPGLPPAP